jgi:hypothetical protein
VSLTVRAQAASQLRSLTIPKLLDSQLWRLVLKVLIALIGEQFSPGQMAPTHGLSTNEIYQVAISLVKL